MYCQKCRTPLKLDSSLEDLNPAAFNLLVGSTNASNQNKPLAPSRPAYPQDRKALYDRVSRDTKSSSFKRSISSVLRDGSNPATAGAQPGTSDGLHKAGAGSFKDNPAMSFVMLSESEVVQPQLTKPEKARRPTSPTSPGSQGSNGQADGIGDEGNKAMSHEMKRVSRLFEILSARSDIDHPICMECTELLVEGLQKRLEEASRERDAYSSFLKQVTASRPTEEELSESAQVLAAAKAAEAEATAELLQLEKEKKEVDAQIRHLEEESLALDQEEKAFWTSRNAFSMRLAAFQNERDSINQKYDHDAQQLEKLQRTNVYNDTFCISHDGSFGTINGLRLGRLSHVPVDWPEINAAWGHTLLLLSTVAQRLNFSFEGYDLLPMGSTSRIIKIDTLSPSTSRTSGSGGSGSGSGTASSRQQPQHGSIKPPKRTILELYSSGDMPLGLTFMHRRFDNAMVAFLECMRQLGAFVEAETAARGEHPLRLPYKIEGDKIGDMSIKLGIAQDDMWSKACKFTLTCCKFLLAHASNVGAVERRRGGG